MEVGKRYELKIEGYDIYGFGVVHKDGITIFVEQAMEGEVVVCEITKITKKIAFGITIDIIKESKNRIKPLCAYYENCGGCDLLHIDYETECRIKENKVRQTLRNKDQSIIQPILRAEKIYGYRNKVMVPYERVEDDVIYGFYAKKSHSIVPMRKCLISSDLDNDILYFIERYLTLFHVSIYNEITHTGIFREVMLRHTKFNEYMVVFIVTKELDLSFLVEPLLKEFPQIQSIYLNLNDQKNNVLLSQKYKLIYGKEVIVEDILGLKFEVSPDSFLQINHDQCELLYQQALRLANIQKNMVVIDAYCGMGSLSLHLAKQAFKVYGIEIVSSSIINANKNKEINHINNVEFICGSCEEKIKELANKEKIDCIVFDPPRKGCAESFLYTVIEMKIPKIIYISCNISTAKRDIDILEKEGYMLDQVIPVDMFPRTSHVESICSLVLRTEAK